jgi:hypothetical protein
MRTKRIYPFFGLFDKGYHYALGPVFFAFNDPGIDPIARYHPFNKNYFSVLSCNAFSFGGVIFDQ